MFTKIRTSMFAVAAVAALGAASLITTTTSADARGFGGGGGGFRSGGMGGGHGMMRMWWRRPHGWWRHPCRDASCRDPPRWHPPRRHPPHPSSAPDSAAALVSSLPVALQSRRSLAASVGRAGCDGGSGCDVLCGCAGGCGGSAALHLPDQGIHAGQSGGVQGPVHEGSRVRSGRQHASAAPASGTPSSTGSPAAVSQALAPTQNPGLGWGSCVCGYFVPKPSRTVRMRANTSSHFRAARCRTSAPHRGRSAATAPSRAHRRCARPCPIATIWCPGTPPIRICSEFTMRTFGRCRNAAIVRCAKRSRSSGAGGSTARGVIMK